MFLRQQKLNRFSFCVFFSLVNIYYGLIGFENTNTTHNIIVQNGASQIDNNHVNATHPLNDKRHLNSEDLHRRSTMTGSSTPSTPKITAIDQHNNPFVYKIEISFLRKISVRKVFMLMFSISIIHKISQSVNIMCFGKAFNIFFMFIVDVTTQF